jgi:hypothetical protein
MIRCVEIDTFKRLESCPNRNGEQQILDVGYHRHQDLLKEKKQEILYSNASKPGDKHLSYRIFYFLFFFKKKKKKKKGNQKRNRKETIVKSLLS